jgi:hypothetical protein
LQSPDDFGTLGRGRPDDLGHTSQRWEQHGLPQHGNFPGKDRLRELEVEVWYPAAGTRGFPSTPYLAPLAAAHFLARNNLPPRTTLPQTTGHAGAPVDRRDGPFGGRWPRKA